MKFHIAAAAAVLAMSGAAFAQNTSAPVTSPNNPVQAQETEWTESERMMYEGDVDYSTLFTDESRTAVLEGDEFTTAFSGMTETDRASIITACEDAELNQGNYGAITLGLCDQVGAFNEAN